MARYGRLLFRPKRSDCRPFMILSHYRSGSTLLSHLLRCHPEVECSGEVFLDHLATRPPWVLFPRAFLKGEASRSGRSHFGLILRVDQLEKCLIPRLHPTPRAFISRLVDDGWSLIHLSRRNVLHQAISNVIAHARDQWHLERHESGPTERVRVDPDMVVRWTKWNQRILRDERTIVEALPHLALVYEDDLLDGERHQPTLDRTFAHLGLPSHPVTAPLRRTGAGSLAERIANYEEIVAHIRTTPFATYLQD